MKVNAPEAGSVVNVFISKLVMKTVAFGYLKEMKKI